MSGRRLPPRPGLYLLVALCCPSALWASSGDPAFSNLLLVIAAMLAVGKAMVMATTFIAPLALKFLFLRPLPS